MTEIVPEENSATLPENFIPSPQTYPLNILCPICSDEIEIQAYSTVAILGVEQGELIISGSLHGTTRHSCNQVG
jgi:hypothetical protein